MSDKKSEKINAEIINNDTDNTNNLENINKYELEIKSIQEDNAKLKKTVQELKSNAKIDSMLIRAGVRNPVAARALLEVERDGEIEHEINFEKIQTQINELKTSDDYLFFRNKKNGIFGGEFVDGAENGDAFEAGFKKY